MGDSSLDFNPLSFPKVRWDAWKCDASFLPGDELPAESNGRLYAVLVFVYYGDKIVLADIAGRGYCIPSGRIEPGETIIAAALREVYEETGVTLKDEDLFLIGSYELVGAGSTRASTRYCPVFIAEAIGFEPVPAGSESRGILLAAAEDVEDLYYHWDPLMDAVFRYAGKIHGDRYKAGISIAELVSE